jgi:hypothetical protein
MNSTIVLESNHPYLIIGESDSRKNAYDDITARQAPRNGMKKNRAAMILIMILFFTVDLFWVFRIVVRFNAIKVPVRIIINIESVRCVSIPRDCIDGR